MGWKSIGSHVVSSQTLYLVKPPLPCCFSILIIFLQLSSAVNPPCYFHFTHILLFPFPKFIPILSSTSCSPSSCSWQATVPQTFSSWPTPLFLSPKLLLPSGKQSKLSAPAHFLTQWGNRRCTSPRAETKTTEKSKLCLLHNSYGFLSPHREYDSISMKYILSSEYF